MKGIRNYRVVDNDGKTVKEGEAWFGPRVKSLQPAMNEMIAELRDDAIEDVIKALEVATLRWHPEKSLAEVLQMVCERTKERLAAKGDLIHSPLQELYYMLKWDRTRSDLPEYHMGLLVEIDNSEENKAYCCDGDDYEDCRVKIFDELEKCGLVWGEKKTSHAYDETYYFYLTKRGADLVEHHLKEVQKEVEK